MTATEKSAWPSFSEAEVQAVADVIRSNKVNYWTGQVGRSFEREFAKWVGTSHAVALANGTLALDVALKALGVGPGDEVIVTPRTFIASISCVVNAGATPVFADIDRDSGNISAATIAPQLTARTRAIIPVHLAGWPCDMPEIMRLADQHGLTVIEDCAQAHGASIAGRSVGSIGHVAAWSFCQDKIMTTGGEGGMVTTNDPALWSAMWSFKDHGKSWEAVYEREHPPGFRWVHESFGTNWRMLEVQAAIGRIQLDQVAAWGDRRTQIALRLADALGHYASAVRVPMPETGFRHAFYRLYAYVRPDGLKAGWSRDRIVNTLNIAGVQVLHGTCSEVYLEKAFEGASFRPEQRLPVARELGETSLMFLTHPTMGDDELDRSAAAIHMVLGEATR
jgi:dTDP-4-amino-4,6-dideoxygalactose transaminase